MATMTYRKPFNLNQPTLTEVTEFIRLVKTPSRIQSADEDAALADAYFAARKLMRPEPPQTTAILNFDPEHLIAAVIPGGKVCDPQQVADAIRLYFSTPKLKP